jgi:hypothetical protein
VSVIICADCARVNDLHGEPLDAGYARFRQCDCCGSYGGPRIEIEVNGIPVFRRDVCYMCFRPHAEHSTAEAADCMDAYGEAKADAASY